MVGHNRKMKLNFKYLKIQHLNKNLTFQQLQKLIKASQEEDCSVNSQNVTVYGNGNPRNLY